VYRAHDPDLDREVALKVLRPAPAGAPSDRNRQLVAEARAAAGVRHPNIVAIHDIGMSDGVAFIVMDLVEGETLRQRLGKGPIAPRDGERWMRTLATALAAAHEAGFVHRDVKPENVLVDESGVLKLLDFGIARRIVAEGEAPESTRTQDGVFRGTPRYMAPESLAGGPPSALADQYAWGLVAYETFASRSPRGEPFDPYLDVAPLASVAPDVPPAMARAVDRALARKPAARFASMSALLETLDALDAPVDPAAEPSPRRTSRTWLAVAALAVALAGGALAFRLRARPPDVAVVTTADAGTVPTLASPGAAAYARALGALRAGSPDVVDALNEALTLDPLLAPAHLRLSIFVAQFDTALSRTHYQAAVQLEQRLTPSDRALLRATEALFAADPAEWAARIDAAVAAYPDDPELLYHAAQAHLARYELEIAARDAARVLALDPGYAAATGFRVEALAYLGDRETALKESASCSPHPDCLRNRMWLLSEMGRCEELATTATRAIASGSLSFDSRALLADALASSGHLEAAQVAIDAERAAATEEPVRARLALRNEARAAELRGDFVTAESALTRWNAATKDLADLERHASPVADLLDLYDEIGQPQRAAAVGASFLAKKDAWISPAVMDDDALRADPTPRALEAVFRAGGGGHSRAWWGEQRRAWEAAISARLPAGQRNYLWMFGEAAVVETPEEARAALARLAELGLPVPPYRPRERRLEAVGHTYMLAGADEQARAELASAARSCSAQRDPFGNTRAHDLYGQALERSGDTAGACAEYAVVLARWGAAKPSSHTAAHAKQRAAALRCSPAGP
jgi:serine/threonine-protein kinase